MKTPVKKPLVLCEGKEDRLVMEELAKRAGLAGRLDFEAYGGKDKLRNYLSMLNLPIDWEDEVFKPLKELLVRVAG